MVDCAVAMRSLGSRSGGPEASTTKGVARPPCLSRLLNRWACGMAPLTQARRAVEGADGEMGRHGGANPDAPPLAFRSE